jgi:hypothetical protein
MNHKERFRQMDVVRPPFLLQFITGIKRMVIAQPPWKRKRAVWAEMVKE